jgi:Na+/melibiose symporter-like transporter
MLPDTVEYGQWKTGIRSEGIPFAFFSFMQKLGLAVSGALAAFVLSQVGFEANKEQAPEVLTAIKWLFNLAPAGYSLLCFIALIFYKLDNNLFDKIKAELAEKDAASAIVANPGPNRPI